MEALLFGSLLLGGMISQNYTKTHNFTTKNIINQDGAGVSLNRQIEKPTISTKFTEKNVRDVNGGLNNPHNFAAMMADFSGQSYQNKKKPMEVRNRDIEEKLEQNYQSQFEPLTFSVESIGAYNQESESIQSFVTMDRKMKYSNEWTEFPKQSGGELDENMYVPRGYGMKLERQTGNFPLNFKTKKEIEPLFENKHSNQDKGNIVDNQLSRIQASEKREGELLETPEKIQPIRNFRVLNKNQNSLRVKGKENQSYSFEPTAPRVWEEKRPTLPNLQKIEKPRFRIDLPMEQTGGVITRASQYARTIPTTTQRETTTVDYQGPAGATVEKNKDNNGKFQEPSKSEIVSNRVDGMKGQDGMLRNRNSYLDYENQRDTTSVNKRKNKPEPSHAKNQVQNITPARSTIKETMLYSEGFNINKNDGNYLDNFDKPAITNRDTMLEPTQNRNMRIGYNDMKVNLSDNAKTTIRNTIKNNDKTFLTGQNNNTVHFSDTPMQTIKETTMYQNNGHFTNMVKNQTNHFSDTANLTIRETTNFQEGGHLKGNNTHMVEMTQEAKVTTKETNLYQYRGNVVTDTNNIVHFNDQAKTTIKQMTNKEQTGNIFGFTNHKTDLNDEAKITMKEVTSKPLVMHVTKNAKAKSFDPNNKPAITNRQTMTLNTHQTNVNNEQTNGYLTTNTIAPTTQKETLVENKYISHVKGNDNARDLEHVGDIKTCENREKISKNRTPTVVRQSIPLNADSLNLKLKSVINTNRQNIPDRIIEKQNIGSQKIGKLKLKRTIKPLVHLSEIYQDL